MIASKQSAALLPLRLGLTASAPATTCQLLQSAGRLYTCRNTPVDRYLGDNGRRYAPAVCKCAVGIHAVALGERAVKAEDRIREAGIRFQHAVSLSQRSDGERKTFVSQCFSSSSSRAEPLNLFPTPATFPHSPRSVLCLRVVWNSWVAQFCADACSVLVLPHSHSFGWASPET
ncbi:hypothetical protein B0H65DRAFT_14980 [Neurospora tetraspora]|uniref:Secreted protein n=1 Tax=Neurospora tetraspora TaxID=94610 RepID=A0AAE0JMR4_9PEZI|nr:hypothetical protein B0H65DRAFT_14980 [Neurospora tetraspora]